jgi:N-acetylglucosamine-6-phosphate deacetylase
MIISGRLLDGTHPGSLGWIEVADDVIVAVHDGEYPGTADIEAAGYLTPGFVDVHCHGGGGASFTDGLAAGRIAADTHREQGTTTVVASLVTASWPELTVQAYALQPLIEAGTIAGIHLEGPWLSAQRAGAHDVDKLQAPVFGSSVLPPGVVLVTIAPELPGALDMIAELTRQGIVVAIGHSNATYDEAAAAFAAGATGVTHLFNAMPKPFEDPHGLVRAALDADAWLELIFDGHHVPTDAAVEICRAYPDRVVLITDAMAAAGLGDGHFTLGGLGVTVSGGVTSLDVTGRLAGSTLTLRQAFDNAVAAGIPRTDAIKMVTCNPAAYLHLPHVGSLAPGHPARFLDL